MGGPAAAAGGLIAAASALVAFKPEPQPQAEPQRHVVRPVGAAKSPCRRAASLVYKLFGYSSACSYGRQAGSALGRSIVGRRRRGSDGIRGAGRRRDAR